MRRRNFPSFFLSYQRSNVINEARERASTDYHPATHCFESTTNIEESYYYAGIKKITSPPNKALSIRETSVLNKKKLDGRVVRMYATKSASLNLGEKCLDDAAFREIFFFKGKRAAKKRKKRGETTKNTTASR